MDFRSLLQSFNTISEAEGTVHKGTYGTSYGKEDVRDQYGHRVGKVDKEVSAKKDAPKQGRGRPKKDGGEGAKFDTSALSAAFGSKKPSGKVGTVSKKHSLKEYIEEAEQAIDEERVYRDGLHRDSSIDNPAVALTVTQGNTASAVLANIRMMYIDAKAGRDVSYYIKSLQKLDKAIVNGGDPQVQKVYQFIMDKANGGALKDPKMAMQVMDQAHQMMGYDDIAYATRESVEEEELTVKPMPGASQIVDPEGNTVGTADAQTAAVMKNAAAKGTLNIGQPMKEGKKAKPDYIDADNDKNEKESMKQAFADKEAKKAKIKESLSFNEMSQEAQAEAQEMLAELQDDIENFVNTGHCSDKLEAFLKVHGHAKKKIADEGAIQDFTTHGMDSKPSKFVGVDPAQKPTPWKVDPIQATTDRAIDAGAKAGSFIKNLVAPKKTFEGTTMKDIQVEGWEKQLNSLLTEGITVSSSQGQQGSPDSVSVTASDADAQQLLQVLRQAGLGVFGGGEQPSSNYGAPMPAHGEEPEGHGTEPEASPEVADVDDDIMSLIKKMTGIEQSGEPGQEQGGEHPGTLEPADGDEEGHGQDYEDEEGSEEESGEEQGSEEESGEEEQTDEGNAFGQEVRQKKSDDVPDSQQRITTGGQNLPVKEEESCESCGHSPCDCSDEETVEEGYANEPDEEMAKLKALLSMGNDMHCMKQSQAVGNPVRVAESDMINDWKKLSGIK